MYIDNPEKVLDVIK